MGVRGPVGDGNRIIYRVLAIVAGCRVLGNDIVGDHASCITDVELSREMVVIRELIEAIPEA